MFLLYCPALPGQFKDTYNRYHCHIGNSSADKCLYLLYLDAISVVNDKKSLQNGKDGRTAQAEYVTTI